jgi:hypothetical protein
MEDMKIVEIIAEINRTKAIYGITDKKCDKYIVEEIFTVIDYKKGIDWLDVHFITIKHIQDKSVIF